MNQQQIFVIVKLTSPVIVLYNIFPAFLLTPIGQVTGALLVGTYIWYLNRKQHNATINALRYAPTDSHKTFFEELIRSCDIDPQTVTLKYAYTGEQIAMAMSNTVIIDPVIFSLVDEDPGATPVRNIFNQSFEPVLTATQKQRMVEHKQLLTPAAQHFIFKHELGHVVDHFSPKKLFIIFWIGTVAAYAGIKAGLYMLPVSGVVAILTGAIIGWLTDILATYASNVFFKVGAEKRADAFAIRYSSAQDLRAAAEFFEQHQLVCDSHKEPGNLFAHLPPEIISGHPNGKVRAAYILKALAHHESHLQKS